MDWSGQDAARLFGNCAAMAEGGTVVAVEMVMAAGNDPSPAKPFDLDLLTQPGGRIRTEAELRQLFTAAGLAAGYPKASAVTAATASRDRASRRVWLKSTGVAVPLSLP